MAPQATTVPVTWRFALGLYICIDKMHELTIPDEAGVSTDFPVPTRQVPDEFGGYTEAHGAFKEEYG